NLANPNGGLQKAVRNLKKDNPALVFAMGDMISSCDDAGECTPKYSQWKSATSPFSGKIFAMQGNHDRTGKDKADGAWNAAFNFPKNGPNGFQNMAYSFNHGNTHFAVLDSDKPKEHIINGAQRSWLDQDLARNKKENTFVFFHEPAWPVGAKIGESLDVENSERNALWEIIARHRVTAVFSGHEHIFSRKNVNGVYQFVVGNTDSFDHTAPRAGMAEYAFVGLHYAVVSVTGKKINVKVYTVDGKMVNSFDFQK
ncbi:MAG TPA: metallophosphoesterase, partial [Patescibacteria group bacterium]|nr:metallophosphoesterase [Patescibacteria group bacterium]